MCKITHNLAPKALADIFLQTPTSQYNYNLRGSSTKLFLPLPHSDFLKKSLTMPGRQSYYNIVVLFKYVVYNM
jgi:hypothetical protein